MAYNLNFKHGSNIYLLNVNPKFCVGYNNFLNVSKKNMYMHIFTFMLLTSELIAGLNICSLNKSYIKKKI